MSGEIPTQMISLDHVPLSDRRRSSKRSGTSSLSLVPNLCLHRPVVGILGTKSHCNPGHFALVLQKYRRKSVRKKPVIRLGLLASSEPRFAFGLLVEFEPDVFQYAMILIHFEYSRKFVEETEIGSFVDTHEHRSKFNGVIWVCDGLDRDVEDVVEVLF